MEKKDESLQELDGSPRPCDFGRKYCQLHKNKAGCLDKP